MNPTSIQTCMDTTDWLKGIVQDQETTMMDSSSSSPSGELIPCSSSFSVPPPAVERRLRPQQDQALKCPRCDSTHTKFCYYNNYSLSQPRYFCKTCRRYWTKGGSLRNVPVGGGCRRNKRPGSGGGKRQVMSDNGTPLLLHQYHSLGPSAFNEHGAGTGADLQLSSSISGFFPQITHLGPISSNGHRDFGNFMEFTNGDHVVEEKFGVIVGNPMRTQFFPCTGGNSSVGYGDMSPTGFHVMSPVGFSINGSHTSLMTPLQFEGNHTSSGGDVDVKPNGKLLSLEWQDSGCGDVRRESFGYNSGVGIWSSMENGPHGTTTSTSNPLV